MDLNSVLQHIYIHIRIYMYASIYIHINISLSLSLLRTLSFSLSLSLSRSICGRFFLNDHPVYTWAYSATDMSSTAHGQTERHRTKAQESWPSTGRMDAGEWGSEGVGKWGNPWESRPCRVPWLSGMAARHCKGERQATELLWESERQERARQ